MYQKIIENSDVVNTPLSQIMHPPLPIVKEKTPIDEISRQINKQVPAVLVEQANGKFHIITRHDLISALT